LPLYIAALIDDCDSRNRERFRGCCSHPRVTRNDLSGDYRIIANACGQRLCPHCAESIGLDHAERSERWMRSCGRVQWRFITLTLSSSPESLPAQVKRLRAAFRRLRQQAIWERTQDFGRAHIEITYNASTDRWHPHLHVLAAGRYIPQRTLSNAWHRATGDSYVVDVRQIASIAHAAKYVCKYVAAPIHAESMSLPIGRAVEMIRCGNKSRWVIAYGSAPPFPRREPTTDPTPGEWITIGFLSDFWLRAECGSEFHRAVLRDLSIQPPTLPPQRGSPTTEQLLIFPE
jgi:hypothetical protein